MSSTGPGGRPPHLVPVPANGEATAAQPEPTGSGLSAPTRRGAGTRFISDLVVELGFLPRERVDAAVEEGRGVGPDP